MKKISFRQSKSNNDGQTFHHKQTNKTEQSSDSIRLKALHNQINFIYHALRSKIETNHFQQQLIQTFQKQNKRINQSCLLKKSRDYKKNELQNNQQCIYNDNSNTENNINNLFLLQKIQNDPQKQKKQKKQNQILQNSKKQDQCTQSKHIQQVLLHTKNTSYTQKIILLQKKKKLYEKIQISLKNEQPYIHEKIISRIKRQGIFRSKVVMNTEIQTLINENSKWLDKEKLKVQKQLNIKQLDQVFKENLQEMKNIINKKIRNNDFIFENYTENEVGPQNENRIYKTKQSQQQNQFLLKPKSTLRLQVLQKYEKTSKQIQKIVIQNSLQLRNIGGTIKSNCQKISGMIQKYQKQLGPMASQQMIDSTKKWFDDQQLSSNDENSIMNKIQTLKSQILKLSNTN